MCLRKKNCFLGMSETREQILEEIKIQGDLVRKLKAAKEPKEKVSNKK